MKRHINLKVYSQYTKGETVMKPESIIRFAEMDSAPSVAITDFNCVRGYREFYTEAKAYGIKPIFGLRTYCHFGAGKKKEITLLAKNQKGLQNIYKLVSVSQMRKESADEELYLAIEELEMYREGIVVGMALGWDVIHNLCEDLDGVFVCNNEESAEVYYHDLFGAYLNYVDYVEISPWEQRKHGVVTKAQVEEEKLKRVAQSLVSYLQEKGKYPIAATGGNCYEALEDRCFEVLHSNETVPKRPLSRLKCTELVLKDYEAFLDKESAEQIVLENTSYIADLVEQIELPGKEEKKHRFEIPGAEEELKNRCIKALGDKYGENPPKPVRERMEAELEKIHHGKWESLYIVAAEVSKKCKEMGGISTYRGAVGSSFIAFLLDITETNPLPAHYYCPSCKYTEFVQEECYSGYDLTWRGKARRICPKCSAALRGDGHNIPCESFLGVDGEKNLTFDLEFPKGYIGELRACLKRLVGADRVYDMPTYKKWISLQKATEMVEAHCGKPGVEWEDWEIDYAIESIVGLYDGEKEETCVSRMFFVPRGKAVYDYAPIGYRNMPGVSESEIVLTQVEPYDLCLEKLLLIESQWLTELALIEKYAGVYGQSIDWSEVPITSFADYMKDIGKKRRNILCPDHEIDDAGYGIIAVREDVPPWNVEMLKKIKYLPSKAHVVSEARIRAKIDWYRENCPEAFEEALANI